MMGKPARNGSSGAGASGQGGGDNTGLARGCREAGRKVG